MLPFTEQWLWKGYIFLKTVDVLAGKYKSVERKVRPLPTTLPEDPLLSLTQLPTQPQPLQDFEERLTRERWDALKLGEGGFLTKEEVKLAFMVLKNNKGGLAWIEEEKRDLESITFSW
ncbi:hypothetical protein K439DRAFT_1614638 [Ramaria rubella]|nr:hypothetical protein K439DRAFT_1614638 [Ramaria rubella]